MNSMFRSKLSKTTYQLIEIYSYPKLTGKKILSIPFSIFGFICFINNFDYFTKRDYEEKYDLNKEKYRSLGPYVYPSA